jgi:hypothetical protein
MNSQIQRRLVPTNFRSKMAVVYGTICRRVKMMNLYESIVVLGVQTPSVKLSLAPPYLVGPVALCPPPAIKVVPSQLKLPFGACGDEGGGGEPPKGPLPPGEESAPAEVSNAVARNARTISDGGCHGCRTDAPPSAEISAIPASSAEIVSRNFSLKSRKY